MLLLVSTESDRVMFVAPRRGIKARKVAPTPHLSPITGTVFGPPSTERCQRSRPQGGVPVSESTDHKRALLCLRLAAECRDLAAAASTPELRARVLRMAHLWAELAEQPAVEIIPDDARGDPEQVLD